MNLDIYAVTLSSKNKSSHFVLYLGLKNNNTMYETLGLRTQMDTPCFISCEFPGSQLSLCVTTANVSFCHCPSSPSLPPPSAGFFFFCTVIPVVPPMLGDCDRGKQGLFLLEDSLPLFWYFIKSFREKSSRLSSVVKVRLAGNQSLFR